MAELSPLDAMALARTLTWEPPLHDDYPGVIPEGAWPVWRRFESFALQEIAWRRVDGAAWRAARQAEDAPVFEADVGGDYLALTQEDWSGFPDPPEWGLHVATAEGFEHLGNFDVWPKGWAEASLKSN